MSNVPGAEDVEKRNVGLFVKSSFSRERSIRVVLSALNVTEAP